MSGGSTQSLFCWLVLARLLAVGKTRNNIANRADIGLAKMNHDASLRRVPLAPPVPSTNHRTPKRASHVSASLHIAATRHSERSKEPRPALDS